MGKTVNILGDTPKEQWLNAIGIMEACIVGNTLNVRDELRKECEWTGAYSERECGLCAGQYGEYVECAKCCSLDTAMRNTKMFADEMRRLAENLE